MQTTKLTTVEAVTAAINELVDRRLTRGRAPIKPAQEGEECARFADLYEMRAALWHELGIRARNVKRIDNVYASACAVAESHDRNQVKHWRRLAGAR
jgi:hypothetical protein